MLYAYYLGLLIFFYGSGHGKSHNFMTTILREKQTWIQFCTPLRRAQTLRRRFVFANVIKCHCTHVNEPTFTWDCKNNTAFIVAFFDGIFRRLTGSCAYL